MCQSRLQIKFPNSNSHVLVKVTTIKLNTFDCKNYSHRHKIIIIITISNLSNNMYKASSKTIPPHTAI